MTHFSTRAVFALLAFAVSGLIWIAQDAPASAQPVVEIVSAQVEVRAVSVDTIELCIRLGEADELGERLCPRQRRFPHAATALGRWLQSERIEVGPQSTVRIRVRRTAVDRIEFALALETSGERSVIAPQRRFLTPSRLAVGRLARSSPVELTLLPPAAPVPAIPGQGVSPGAPTLELGKLATNFSLPNLGNEEEVVELANYFPASANTVMIIVFWSSWAPNDADVLTALDEISAELSHVRVLGVNVYDELADARAVVEQRGLRFVNVRDATGGVAAHYRIGGLPEIYLIDAGGIYRERLEGAVPDTLIRAAIRRAGGR